MSNVIKAVNIRYKNEIKTIDTNKRADEFQRLYIENLPQIQQIGDGNGLEAAEEYFVEEIGQTGTDENEESVTDNQAADEYIAELRDELENEKKSFYDEKDALIESAKKEAELIIQNAYDEIARLKTEAIDAGKEEGYKCGYEAGEQEAEKLKAELEGKIQENELDYQKQVQEMEPAFVELVISLLKKMTGVIVDGRRDLILHIIHQSMMNIESSNNYIIRVSKDDYDFVNSKKSELLFELKASAIIEIIEDPVLQRAQCTIETDTRIMDCSLDVQLKNLIADLKLLSGIV